MNCDDLDRNRTCQTGRSDYALVPSQKGNRIKRDNGEFCIRCKYEDIRRKSAHLDSFLFSSPFFLMLRIWNGMHSFS